MPLVRATALPVFAPALRDDRLRALCSRWERRAAPGLSPGQREHCSRFAPAGDALMARASRLLARLLALSALPEGAVLDRDAAGRPRVTGAPGWEVAFTHSGRAAFCLICAPGEGRSHGPVRPALDTEALATAPPDGPPFAAPAPGPGFALRRWTLAEALFKALGAPPDMWGTVAATAHRHAGARAGAWAHGRARLDWRFLPAPGHVLCVALPGAAPQPLRLHWIPWQCLA